MERFLLQDAIQVTATSTATTLASLITTADSDIVLPNDINYILLNVEGDVRYSSCGTPTASVGVKIASGGTQEIYGVHPNQLQLIRVGGSDVKVNIEIGRISSVVK